MSGTDACKAALTELNVRPTPRQIRIFGWRRNWHHARMNESTANALLSYAIYLTQTSHHEPGDEAILSIYGALVLAFLRGQSLRIT